MTKSRPHLLLVDDEASIRDPLGKYLERQGFRVSDASNASTARSMLLSYDIDLVLLDIMMPGEDGLSLCRHISANGSPPVILLTAKSEETDRIVGLENRCRRLCRKAIFTAGTGCTRPGRIAPCIVWHPQTRSDG